MPRGSYIPKSKIVVKNSGGELAYVKTNTPYKGPYIETSKGRFFVGTSNINYGAELYKLHNPYDEEANTSKAYFGVTKEVNKFNIINKGLKTFLKKTSKIPSSKPRPTITDYGRGYFRRYFAKRVNGSKYIEINNQIFKDIQSKKGKYDHNLYQVGHLAWFITGNVYKFNSLSLSRSNLSFPYIMNLFFNLHLSHLITFYITLLS